MEPSWVKLFHLEGAPETFLKLDAWHNWHGGAGKTSLGSTWQELEACVEGSNIETRFDVIAGKAKKFCQSRNLRLCLGTIKHTTFGGFDAWPEGSWSKFADTTVLILCHFISHTFVPVSVVV